MFRVNRTGTGVYVDCSVSVRLVMGRSGMNHISRTGTTGEEVDSIISVGLVLGQ